MEKSAPGSGPGRRVYHWHMDATSQATLERNLRIVLVGTQHPGNIGSAARAMKAMGLTRLVLVAPEKAPDRDTHAMAAGADDLIEAAPIYAGLVEAISDCRWVLGCTARNRRIQLEPMHPRAAAGRAVLAAANGPVALVFGRERSGLDNAEMALCHGAVHIPSNPEFSSLNLAAAVQVLSYELRCALLGDTGGEGAGRVEGTRTPPPSAEAATHAQLEGLFEHLATTLDAIDFHKGRKPDSALRKLRRLYLRANLDPAEVRLLHGILADSERMARLAGQRTVDGEFL